MFHVRIGLLAETLPGQDGVVRTVKVKTPNNEIIRLANKFN